MLINSAERSSDSPYIQLIWRTQSVGAGAFISPAVIYGELVLMRYKGRTTLTVRGPETKATPAPIPADAEWLGIMFRLGTFMPHFTPTSLIDRHDVNLPQAAGSRFWLCGSAWEFPTYENADTFIDRLKREELLAHDPLVEEVRQGCPHPLSRRAMQYRFLHATGMTQRLIHQIERARRAAALLEGGMSIFDTVHETGYFDQSHLTNELKRFVGQTPAQIARLAAAG